MTQGQVPGQGPTYQAPRVASPIPVQQPQPIPIQQGRLIQQGQPYPIIQQQPYQIIQQPYGAIQQPYPTVGPPTVLPSPPQPQPQPGNSLNQELAKKDQLLEQYRQRVKTDAEKYNLLKMNYERLQQSARSNPSDASLQQKIDEVRKSLTAKAEMQTAELNNQLQTARQELSERSSAFDQQSKINSELQEEINSLRMTNQANGDQEPRISALTQQVEQFKVENASLTEHVNNMQESLRSRVDQVVELETQNNQLSRQMQELQLNSEGLADEITSLTNKPAVVNTVVADDSELRNQLAAATQHSGRLERRLTHSNSKLKSLYTENEELRRENLSLTDANAVEVNPVVDTVATATSYSAPALETGGIVAGAGALASDSSEGKLMWPVKYWILGLMLIGLAVALAVTWGESNEQRKLKQHEHKPSQ